MPESKFTPDDSFVCRLLRQRLDRLMGIYCFGSRSQGTARPDSDLDLAVLTETYVDPVTLWNISGEIASRLDMDVDLLDLRAASTVMQFQVITTGRRLWARDIDTDYFELYVLSQKLDLELLRKPLLDQIREEGRIYG